MSKRDAFDTLVSPAARDGEVTTQTLRTYIKLGLIEAVRLPNGMDLVRADAGAQARELKAQRIANRGRRSA